MSAKLYVGDNVEVLRRVVPDDSIQLTVTSPPYDNLRKYNGFTWDFEAVARELFRVTKPGGVVVWVVADATVNGSETGTSFRQALYFRDVCGFNQHDTMIYEKNGTGACGSNLAYWQCFEYMFVFSKGRPRVVNRLKQPNINAGKSVGVDRVASDGSARGYKAKVSAPEGVRPNVWCFTVGNNGDDPIKHPGKFPEALARDHVLSWSNAGDNVLDPFVGSGTTGKMAVLNSRSFIGIDISPAYVDLSKGRIPGAEVLTFEA